MRPSGYLAKVKGTLAAKVQETHHLSAKKATTRLWTFMEAELKRSYLNGKYHQGPSAPEEK